MFLIPIEHTVPYVYCTLRAAVLRQVGAMYWYSYGLCLLCTVATLAYDDQYLQFL